LRTKLGCRQPDYPRLKWTVVIWLILTGNEPSMTIRLTIWQSTRSRLYDPILCARLIQFIDLMLAEAFDMPLVEEELFDAKKIVASRGG